MARDYFKLDKRGAADLVQRYVGDHRLTTFRLLHGGMVHRVYEVFLEGGPTRSIVAKLNHPDYAEHFEHEYAVLDWYHTQTQFPVPAPIDMAGPNDDFNGCGILMQRIFAPNLADANLSPRGMHRFQTDLGRYVAALHAQRRDSYGSVFDEDGYPAWLDVFGPMFEKEFHACRQMISSRARSVIDSVYRELDHWLPESGIAAMVHGDLWATNILVDDSHPDRPEIRAFIDLEACYCDPEYELAYLQVFRTVDQSFFNEYGRYHQLRPGFDRRSRVYWLNTMMLHCRIFGERYIENVEHLATQLRQYGARG